MFPLKDENPNRIFPLITWALLGVNVLVFIWEMLTPLSWEEIFDTYGFVPSRGIIQLGIFTSVFLHGDVLHLAGNMLYLYVFGDNVEDACGYVSYIFFYIVCGVAASLLLMFIDPYSSDPVIGASGAISGILGAYIILYPRARIRTAVLAFHFIHLVYLPAFALIGFWFILQLGYALLGVYTGVAYWAHIGGFLAGLLLIRFCSSRRRMRNH